MKDSYGNQKAVVLISLAICTVAGLVTWTNSRAVSSAAGSGLMGNPSHTPAYRTGHQPAPEFSSVAPTREKQSLHSLLDVHLRTPTQPGNKGSGSESQWTLPELASEIRQNQEKNEAVLHIADLALRHPELQIRKQAVELLAEIGDELAINVLIDSLAATDLELRQLALSALHRLGNRVPIRPLVDLVLHSEDEAVQAEVLSFVRRFADPESIREIEADLQRPAQSSDDPLSAQLVAETLVQNRKR